MPAPASPSAWGTGRAVPRAAQLPKLKMSCEVHHSGKQIIFPLSLSQTIAFSLAFKQVHFSAGI